MKHKTAIRQSREDVCFSIVITIISTLVLVIVLYPLIYIVSASFSSPMSVVQGKVWLLPKEFTLKAYHAVVTNKELITGYRNSLIYTVVGTAFNLLMTIICAYPLSRKDLRGRNFLTIMISITMFFSGGTIPTFLCLKQLNMLNTFGVMIIPGAINVWNMILMRNYFQNSIPEEIIEAAKVDGCTNVGALIRIVLPLSKAITAVMVVYYAVGHWNSYFNALLYLKDRWRYPLQLVLREVLLIGTGMRESTAEVVNSVDQLLLFETQQFAIIIVASLPVLILYPALQKYFMKGVMVGSIKG
ncbi:MAG: carbohydrate ABC transporter permease [Ruthenibacterium lactatiformans]|mgnify:FL=1